MKRQGLPRLSCLALGLLAWGCATKDGALLKGSPDRPAGDAAVSTSESTRAAQTSSPSGGSTEGSKVVQASAREAAGSPIRAQKPDTTQHSASSSEGELPLTGDAVRARPVSAICGAVNGQPIFDEEVKTAAGRELGGARTQKEYAEAFQTGLRHIIDREVVLQEAFHNLEKGGKQGQQVIDKLNEEADKHFEQNFMHNIMKAYHLKTTEEVSAALESQHMSLDVLRRFQTREWLFTQYMVSRLEPHLHQIGYRQIVEYYTGHPEEFQVAESIDWQDVFVESALHGTRADARRWAEHLAQRIRKDEDFQALSKEYDNGDSRNRKGAGQGHRKGEIDPPALEEPLFQMKEGEVRVIEMPSGYHIVRLVKHQQPGLMPFDAEVQKKIRMKLQNDVWMSEMKRYVEKVKRTAAIWPESAAASSP